MLNNFFAAGYGVKTGFRSLINYKITGFINLFGLSVGMTAAVFIFLWVHNEVSFDSYHAGKNDIYRITNSIQINREEAWVWEGSPMLMADAAIKQIPEVEKSTRVLLNTWGSPVLTINNKLFSEKSTAYIDKNWFNVFHYDFTAGSLAAFSNNPFSIILTTAKAKKYFGDANPVGQIIRVDTVNYTVQAIVKDNPVNSSFRFDILMQMDGRLSDPRTVKNDKSWNNFGYITFLQLQTGARKSIVEGKLNDIINKNRANHNDLISLTALPAMYFENNLQESGMPHGSRATTYIFSLLGFLLLITACINYVNLTTAKASLRAKEVSVRKIIGAQRKHLFYQFMMESMIVSGLALLTTLLLIQLCLPVFNTVTERHFELPFSSPSMWKILLGTLMAATLLNGIYPAALLSSFQPLSVFRGRNVLKLRDGSVRKGLVVFQFVLSMLLITGTIVIYKQLHFIQTRNPGYDVAQVVSIPVPYKNYGNLKGETRNSVFRAMKQELQSQAAIAEVCTGGAEIISVLSASSGNADWDGRDTAYNPEIARLSVDADFQKFFRLRVKAGYWFRPGNEDEHNYVINETAAAEFKMHQPLIGQRFIWGGDTGQVIGIVKDFHFKSMHDKIGPIVLSKNQGADSYIFIKTAAGSTPKALGAAEAIWAKFIPDEPFDYRFLDDSFNTLYQTDLKTSELMIIFSVIAIIISGLGLFGLSAFTAGQRTKEIGIRKVLGATVQQIATLLSKEFISLVLVAIVIATPIAWWVMNKWLEGFAYRIDISAGIFVSAGILALSVAIFSVSYQAIKAAVANPARSLRTE